MQTIESIVFIIVALRALRRRQGNTRKRTCYMREVLINRDSRGEFTLVKELRENDPQYHHRYFRMKKETFDKLLDGIHDQILGENTHSRPVSPIERLSITIRYLATGNSQVSMAMSYRVGLSTVSGVLRQVMRAICTAFKDKIRKPQAEDWMRVESEFRRKWNFPLCMGSIDGKHIRIKKPPGSGSQYFNYTGFYSVVLLAVIDANLRFLLIDHGASGSCSDGGVLQRSVFGKKLEKQKYDFPASQQLPTGETLSPVIIGDEGFPLKKYLMKPYSRRTMEHSEKVYNYRLSRARMTSKDAFGLLAARWRIFHTEIEGNLELVKLIIKTSIILHNFVIDEGENGYHCADVLSSREHNDGVLTDLENQHCINACRDAFKLRDTFRDHFVSEGGQVSWQEERVMRGYE